MCLGARNLTATRRNPGASGARSIDWKSAHRRVNYGRVLNPTEPIVIVRWDDDDQEDFMLESLVRLFSTFGTSPPPKSAAQSNPDRRLIPLR